MKCKYCGAEIKTGSSICEYCNSAVERDVSESRSTVTENRKPPRSAISVIGRVIVSLAFIFAALIVITLIIVINSDVFKNTYEYTTSARDTYRRPSDSNNAYNLPADKTGLTGQIISCDENGVASIEYDDALYSDVKILDNTLIEWINETGRSIDTVGIRFATDANGDISELGLLSPDFFVMALETPEAQDTIRYIAVRDGQIISFTSAVPLEAGRYYSGYFSYPDMDLYYGEEQSLFATTHMDPKCSDKESATEQEYYTGEDITVYKICVDRKWYYCCKEVYDAIQAGDLLNDYTLYSNQEMSFIIKD